MGYKQWNLNQFNAVGASTAAALTNSEIKAAPAAGSCIYVTDYMISNEGAINVVSLLNGSGGAAKLMFYLPANTTVQGRFEVPIKLSAATALCLTTTGADHCVVYINGFISRG